MLKYFYVFITFTVISFNLNAQTKNEERFIQLIKDFNQAIINTDSTALNNMVCDELSYGHSGGVIQDKAAFIAGVMNGPTFFKSIDPQGQTLKLAGKNAIVRNIVVAQAVNKGGPLELKFGNIMVWKKEKGKWRLLARQGYKL